MGAPAIAEVTRTTDNSFVSRHEVVVEATTKDVWLALISPAGWWRSEHTWSGEAKNLTLVPQAGGCFCETIPEVDEPDRFTLEGSVEHMRVVQSYPEEALRMVGGLGPLQSEPVMGVLTIVLTKVDAGTRIVWEYNVGGTMRYEVPVISKAVDGVMGQQIAALAKPLIVVPAPKPVVAPSATPGSGMAAPSTSGDEAKPVSAPSPQVPPPAAPKAEARPASKAPSVEDVFGGFSDEPAGSE